MVSEKGKNGAWIRAVGLLGAVGAIYIGLPYLLVQRLNLGIVRQGSGADNRFALTFDDGPDPATTPAVLDALQAQGVRATFFVIAANAEAHPDLIARLLQEGHEVEPHAARHVHAWIRSPWGAFLDPLRAARRVSAVTGRPARYHRPPHGAYTLATVLGQRFAGVIGAHWSAEGGDWERGATPETLPAQVLAKLHPGAVLVLHDAGPGARVTVPALPELLRQMQQAGWQAVPLGELSGAKPRTWREVLKR
ncbi:polysaccharide deacetylase family protein [Deinococcus aquatilis]|uniref:polysaccharide deacetylase family protein n=1 Tax=Deinococcus aquatilis TaxID=519440 RepID=UPI0003624090|nr:polysaccharide deacetylase family protein [Deinococcus aquatilis]